MYYNLTVSYIFFAGLGLAILIFVLTGKHKIAIKDDVLLEQAAVMISTE